MLCRLGLKPNDDRRFSGIFRRFLGINLCESVDKLWILWISSACVRIRLWIIFMQQMAICPMKTDRNRHCKVHTRLNSA